MTKDYIHMMYGVVFNGGYVFARILSTPPLLPSPFSSTVGDGGAGAGTFSSSLCTLSRTNSLHQTLRIPILLLPTTSLIKFYLYEPTTP